MLSFFFALLSFDIINLLFSYFFCSFELFLNNNLLHFFYQFHIINLLFFCVTIFFCSLSHLQIEREEEYELECDFVQVFLGVLNLLKRHVMSLCSGQIRIPVTWSVVGKLVGLFLCCFAQLNTWNGVVIKNKVNFVMSSKA